MRAARGVDLCHALEELGGVLAGWGACGRQVQRGTRGGHALGFERWAELAVEAGRV